MDLRPDQVRGVLLGAMVGDALGMPVEGWSARMIRARHGELREMLSARIGRGSYTDDTQMMLALAEALLDTPGRVDRDRVAARFAASLDPARGYGGNTIQVLAAIRSGVPWPEAAERHAPAGGSWANGAAMRVASVAIAFYPDADRVARAAAEQADVTGHTHPVGRGGAVVQALAVRLALELGASRRPVDTAAFAGALLGQGGEEYDTALRWIAQHPDADPDEAGARLGTSGRASESVPMAVWAFLSRAHDAEAVIVRAVNAGGDTDTIGAMAGALAAGYNGERGLPSRWIDALENGQRGRDYARRLADRLADRRRRGTAS